MARSASAPAPTAPAPTNPHARPARPAASDGGDARQDVVRTGAGEIGAPDVVSLIDVDRPAPAQGAGPEIRELTTRTLPEERAGVNPETGESMLNYACNINEQHIDALVCLYFAQAMQPNPDNHVKYDRLEPFWDALHPSRPYIQPVSELSDAEVVSTRQGNYVAFKGDIVEWIKRPANRKFAARFLASFNALRQTYPTVRVPRWLDSGKAQ